MRPKINFISAFRFYLPLLLAFNFLAASFSSALDFPDKPPDEDFFVDNANLIDAQAAEEVNNTARSLLKEEKVALIVVTIPSLLFYDATHMSIESYAQALFDEWGLGSQERNYGMLLLISKGDRKARIELGNDWAHKYDRAAQKIMDTLIIPQFKAGNFSKGILEGVRGMDAMARGLALPKPKTPWWFWPLAIGSLILVIWTIVSLFKSGKSGWGWALIAALALVIFFILRTAASSGGSGGSFGGGSSGGGGASGSW